MSGQRVTSCLLLLALLVPRLAAHGYGTRPPWVAAGVVRVLAPGDDAYLEVRVQHSGHLGARGALSAPDLFRIVRLGESGSARTTPRWERERQRRTLAAGDTLVGSGVVARAPLALALFPGGAAFAVADRHGVSVQERDGAARFHAEYSTLFGLHGHAEATEEHAGNSVWPFGWLEAPPRTVALWSDGAALVVALRTRSGQWLLRCVDATTGAGLPDQRSELLLTAALAAPAAPEASIALEVLALGVEPWSWPVPATVPSAPPRVALDAARQVITNERATVEARLVAAQVLARSARGATAAASPNATARASEHTEPGDLELASATALGVLQAGDGHPSMDDLLAAAVLTTLAPTLTPERFAAPLAELALARGVPELFPALVPFGGAGVTALADAWLAVGAGRLSPYAEPRATSLALVHHLARAIAAPPGAPSLETGAATGNVDGPLTVFARWLDVASAPEQPRSPDGADSAAARGALLAALLTVEPTLDALGEAEPDVRALLVRALGNEHPAALVVAGPATRALVGALVDALVRAAGDERNVARPADAADRAARASASLQHIVDVPPVMSASTRGAASARVAGVEARRWSEWWRASARRPQAAELATLVARGVGPELVPPYHVRRFVTRPGSLFGSPGTALGAALEGLFAEPRPDTWRVLERGLGVELERLDELGLRGVLRRALEDSGAEPISAEEEKAARERVQRALGRAPARS